ncbi:MAG: TolC family outer membrane protein [Marinobacterium sp.]|nr:TolC family outer membrane protein [Marinobacterium sp.]
MRMMPKTGSRADNMAQATGIAPLKKLALLVPVTLMPVALMTVATALPVQAAANLPDVVTLVLEKHPQLLRSAAALDESVQRIDVARADYLPTLDLNAEAGIEVIDNPSTRSRNQENDSWDRRRVSLELRQSLFSGYNTTHEVARTEYFADARRLELAALQENLTLSATQAYLTVLNRRAKYERAEVNLTSHEKIFDQIRSRVEQGVGTRADLAQISSRLNSANANFLTAENNLRDAEADYLRVVGELPEDELAAVSITEDLLPDSLEDAQAILYSKNPTVQAAEVDINEARSQHARTRSAFMPNVDFVARASYGEDLDAVAGRDENYAALVEMRWNLLNGGADRAERRAAAQQVEQARAIHSDAQRQAQHGLQLSWSAFEVLEQQRAFLKNYVRSAENTRDAYRKEFYLGKRTLIDLLDSENEVLRSANEYIDADSDYEAAKARILNAVGQLTTALK